MRSRELNFLVSGQKITKDGDFSNIVKGSRGYLKAVFKLSDEWKFCRVAVSFFTDGLEHPVLLNGNSCMIPDDVLLGRYFDVSLTGRSNNFLIQTGRIRVYQK